MFKRILIANRGEIAVRIARTCRALGVETVCVYSSADRRALHVLESDAAAYVGPAAVAESYLNIDAIVRAAVESKAEAVHPGYGLLSENPDFAEAVAAAGLVFIGPPPSAMRSMGDKSAARKLAASLGVPIIPGYDGDSRGPKDLLKHAKAIGFPVMIKAAAGGGGRGMRIVADAKRFEEALESAARESQRAFGDGRLLLEKAIVGGRHVEIQVIADARGNVVHLGERDCSVQRRHQKVIEEAPSPAVDEDLRLRMGEAAITLARECGYVNAGTVEFLLDADRSFYFLEMNTRLQVEHGVTELVTGLDLVALQLRVAAGEKLPFAQRDITLTGHAIECRIYAEDPARGYLPSAGTLEVFDPPGGDGVRNDVGTYAGDEISTHYDPMLAKLLVWAPDRRAAIARMSKVLAQYRIEGVRTNLWLLRSVVGQPVFEAGDATTDYLDSRASPESLIAAAVEEPLIAAFGALVLGAAGGTDPWHASGPWRPGGSARMSVELDGSVHTLEGQRLPGGRGWEVQVGAKTHTVRFTLAPEGRVLTESGGLTRGARIRRTPDGIEVVDSDQAYAFKWSAGPARPSAHEAHRGHGLTAPMPGLVLKVLVKEGDHVAAHQTLVVLEAMKMEHAIEAPHAGIVKKVHCAEGGRVAEGVLLIELEADGA